RVMRCFADADVDAALADIDPQATLDWSNSNAPDRGVYTGHDEWRAFMRARDEALGERQFDSVELLTPTDDTVVLIGRVLERGRERHRGREPRRRRLDAPGREDRPLHDLPVERRSAESRGPGGIGAGRAY